MIYYYAVATILESIKSNLFTRLLYLHVFQKYHQNIFIADFCRKFKQKNCGGSIHIPFWANIYIFLFISVLINTLAKKRM